MLEFTFLCYFDFYDVNGLDLGEKCNKCMGKTIVGRAQFVSHVFAIFYEIYIMYNCIVFQNCIFCFNINSVFSIRSKMRFDLRLHGKDPNRSQRVSSCQICYFVINIVLFFNIYDGK